MEYTVEEVPAASWRPGLPQALACYRVLCPEGYTIVETPDATETDEQNAHKVAHALNSVSVAIRALKDIHAVTTANMPPSERLSDAARWAEAALEFVEGGS